ncbi:MAG: 16S rRNA (uracil(1498)-N(3))-methyltransferase [Bacteroidales bacterium]|nr:16S rRNA (uracil(1498)-N(3))-methyltransferase [Bacteroidales bacterium]
MELFFSDDIQDAQVRLDPDESAHCVRVLRHREGDEIFVIDGRGTLCRCVLELADAKGAWARVLERTHGFGAHPYHLTMAVCPTKNLDRYEWFVEKATEIGVDVVAPVIGERSERKVLKTERLRRLALSAAKQSLKGAVPQVAEPVAVRDFILSAPAEALKLICYCFDDVERIPITSVLRPDAAALANPGSAHPSQTDDGLPPAIDQSSQLGGGLPPISEHLSQPSGVPSPSLESAGSKGVAGRPIMILIGPEGDFSPEEAALAREHGWIPVQLGPSRLRTETAALTAVTAVYLFSL